MSLSHPFPARKVALVAFGILLGCSSKKSTPEPYDAGPLPMRVDGGFAPATFAPGELDDPSHGGTITFQDIGNTGWYPSRRDPASGDCDALDTDTCCLARQEVTSDALTPWDRDLVLTLRGPLRVKQLAVYQPSQGTSDGSWSLVANYDSRFANEPAGLAFHGNDTESGFGGDVGTECLVDVTTDLSFPCGAASSPYCPANSQVQHYGWAGSKLFVLLARMPHANEMPAGTRCSEDDDGNWYDAPWLGLSLGELSRAGAFAQCQCYAKNPAEWWLADGCGQFNVFEVVNDNNSYRNLEVFSTNFFGYGGYVGEGPCGSQCDVSALADAVDLIDKSENAEAVSGAVASPSMGPGAAFRRPTEGYRYFVVLLDVATRTVQLAVIHPNAIPSSVSGLLPALPPTLPSADVASALALRLPQ